MNCWLLACTRHGFILDGLSHMCTCVFHHPFWLMGNQLTVVLIQKSTNQKEKKWQLLFHFRFSVIIFCVVATVKKWTCFACKFTLFHYCNNTESIIKLNRKWKNNCHFCPCWFIDFWIRSIAMPAFSILWLVIEFLFIHLLCMPAHIC
jgi:hypothetical protein